MVKELSPISSTCENKIPKAKNIRTFVTIRVLQGLKSSKNFFSALIILFNIFINPYGIELKKEKNHFYEKTGMFFYQLRKIVLFKR